MGIHFGGLSIYTCIYTDRRGRSIKSWAVFFLSLSGSYPCTAMSHRCDSRCNLVLSDPKDDWKTLDIPACPWSPSLSLFSTSAQVPDGEGLEQAIPNDKGGRLGSRGTCERNQVINSLPLLWGGGWRKMLGRDWRLAAPLWDGTVPLFAIHMGTHAYSAGFWLVE